jgi:AcrR family transcriptional regulator
LKGSGLRKGEATRARILEEAARQAAQRGLTAVSLADVADAVGLSKSGLFKHFASKEAMQLAVIEAIKQRFRELVWVPSQDLPPGRPRLERIFELQLDWSEKAWPQSGCPIFAFSSELDDQPGAARDSLQQGLEVWRRRLVEQFKAMRDPPVSETEAQLAYFQLKSFLLGAQDARRMMGDADARKLATDAFGALLDRLARAAPVA